MDRVTSSLNALFFGEPAEFAGAFQREMVVRFANDPAQLVPHVAATPKYAAFIAERAQAAAGTVVTAADDLAALGSAVSAQAVARAAAGSPMSEDDVRAAVKGTPPYTAARRARVVQVAAMCGRALTDAQIESIGREDAEGVEELREAIDGLDDYSDASDASDAGGPTDAADASDAPTGDAGSAGETTVDDGFMDDFVATYGRDPTVHEYVHVRNLMATRYLTLAAIAELHATAYSDLEVVHRELLNELLSEPEFCKRYLPVALTDPGLPARTREALLSSDGYRRSMRDRLGALHKTRFGEDISVEEGDYMFERSVLAQQLALQSDKLNDIVDEFAAQTTALYETVTELYVGVLAREPEDGEVRAVLQAFRVDAAAAEAALRRDLVRSLEYREVLRQEIVRARPDMSTPAVFRALEAVLATPRLDAVPAARAVQEALTKV